MNPYPHIDSVYKRDERGKFLIGEYSTPEFEYLSDKLWQWTEKIDGTNIRIMWEGLGTFPTVGGKTDNAQVPTKLLSVLNQMFSADKFEALFPEANSICLYGEGYGAGIQKGGGNYRPDQSFILFDVKIGEWWLERHNVEDIANKLGIDVVPLETTRELNKVIQDVRGGVWDEGKHIPTSSIGTAKIEGFVGTPLVPLFNRKGERIITKVKFKDFM